MEESLPKGSRVKHKRGRTLLLEHLPFIKFAGSMQGVLFFIFANGDACFYPLNDRTNGDAATQAKDRREREASGKITRSRDREGDSSKGTHKQYSIVDVKLELKREHQVFSFPFIVDTSSSLPQIPQRVLLSPNKRLLLLHGARHRGKNCILVYQILNNGTVPFFRLVFYDLCLTFLDACFSPDSNSLVTISRRYPCFLFLLNLNFVLAKGAAHTEPDVSEEIMTRKSEVDPRNYPDIMFEPRGVGPLAIIGPATGVFGQPLTMTRVASSNNIRTSSPSSGRRTFHFVTWNDEGTGEYCLWKITSSNPESIQFEWFPRLICSTDVDRSWLEGPSNPKNYIIEIQFSNKESGKILLLVRRENYGRASNNGIGIQMIKLDSEAPDPSDDKRNGMFWYQITESLEEKDVIALKWTNTLLLGTAGAAAVVIEGKGLFELTDHRYASQFRALYDDFVDNVSNFVQVGRYHRYWVDIRGNLRAMVVVPQTPSQHPEWRDLFDEGSKTKQNILITMRVLGRRIGYFINKIQPDPPYGLENSKSSHRKGKGESGSFRRGKGSEKLCNSGCGNVDAFYGFHLYLCWLCKRTLLKPLMCSLCKKVVYCSRHCQRKDWPEHRYVCEAVLFDRDK